MTSRLSLLFASTALTVALGLPALAAMQTQDNPSDHDGDGDGDGDDCTGAKGNPAPAGTVAPPANGLFGTGAPPVAVTN